MIKFLFFDYQELEVVRGFTRTLHQPKKHSGNPLFTANHPWQRGDMQLYGSVIHTPDGRFHAWYQAHTREDLSLLHYAESDDGLTWRHPSQDVVQVDGQPTSAVFSHAHGAAILYDPADPREDWRFKLVTGAPPSNCISGFHSQNGIHWTPVKRGPIIGSNPDCPMGFFRAPDGRYVIYHRIWGYGRRVFRSESWDFLHWSSEPRLVLEPDPLDDPQLQFYGLGAIPYGSYELGTLWTYRTQETDLQVNKMYGQQAAELAYARSGYAWHRAAQGTPFIPCGPRGSQFSQNPQGTPGTQGSAGSPGPDSLQGPQDAWDSANLHCASQPVFLPNEIRYYFAGTQGLHGYNGWKHIPQPAGLGLATLRPDGFVSLDAGPETATLLTAAFKLPHTRIIINATIAPNGWIRAGLISMADGSPIPGYTLEDSLPLTGDSLAHEIHWRSSASPSPEPNQWVLLQLQAQNASIYSIALASPREEASYHTFTEPNPERTQARAPRPIPTLPT